MLCREGTQTTSWLRARGAAGIQIMVHQVTKDTPLAHRPTMATHSNQAGLSVAAILIIQVTARTRCLYPTNSQYLTGAQLKKTLSSPTKRVRPSKAMVLEASGGRMATSSHPSLIQSVASVVFNLHLIGTGRLRAECL